MSEQHKPTSSVPTSDYASAALRLLDRDLISSELADGWVQSARAVTNADADVRRNIGALVFRIGQEWLALEAAAVVEVAEARPVHSLPHQRNAAVLGILNIRGALRVCISLARLFHIGEDDADAAKGHVLQRPLLVAIHEGQTLVFPVDQVIGVQRYADDDVEAVPTTLAHAGAQYTRGLLDRNGHKVGLLDHGLLFYALNRSMA